MASRKASSVMGLLILILLVAGIFWLKSNGIAPIDVNLSGGNPFQPQTIRDNEQPQVSAPELERQVHELINEQRQDNGLPALGWDDALALIASAHSADMDARDFFDHVNPDGLSPADRGNAAGYPCVKDYGTYRTEGIAENIFQNNLYTSIAFYGKTAVHNWTSQGGIAQSTVIGWMNSPGHRENILTATYGVEGIGVVISEHDGKVFITEDFC